MKKKKVLFLIESFIVGGAEKVLIDIVNNLNPEKYDITVCSVYKHSVYKGYDKTFDKPFKPYIKYKYLINNQHHWLYLVFNYLLLRCFLASTKHIRRGIITETPLYAISSFNI